jgi:uncharacterized RDD family membrane protein YckC
MNESATYSVVLSGNLKSGFELERVIDGFARLFKVPPEKASRIIGTEFVVKRDLELKVAKSYKEKLSGIGVEVLLQRDGGVEELALEPVHLPDSGDDAQSAPLSAEEMICPKCALKQPKAEECSGCGVIVAKVMQRAIPSADAEIVSQVVEPANIYKAPESELIDATREDTQFAGFWIRVGASIIDTILVLAITMPLLTMIYGSEYWAGERLYFGVWDLLFSYVFPAIAVILFWIYRSATPGKMLCKIKIIDIKTGRPPSAGQSIGRYLGYYVSTIPLMLGIIWVAFDKKKQGWHDKMASTAVVKIPQS